MQCLSWTSHTLKGLAIIAQRKPIKSGTDPFVANIIYSMKRIALLINETPKVEDDNYLRFLPELLNLEYRVDLLFIDTLRLHCNRVEASGFECRYPPQVDARWPKPDYREICHETVWLLGLGVRETFLDKFQLLSALPGRSSLINSPDAIMHLKSKYLLATQTEFSVPETYADTNPEALLSIIESLGGDWILKPPAGSLGQDVFRITAGDSQVRERVRDLCARGYAMLQRYLPEIEQGEKRVLLAGGRVISQYRRIAESDHRTNLSRGASAEACDLTPEETELCGSLARYLLDQGAYFCGIDLAWPWLIEVNVINPGGLATIDRLTGRNFAPDVVRAVIDSLG